MALSRSVKQRIRHNRTERERLWRLSQRHGNRVRWDRKHRFVHDFRYEFFRQFGLPDLLDKYSH